ncbi:HAMP domain-containing sensor histidine kinase [Clostridium sp. ZS2-4]|uniref:HAMP domain-containing sensor histidine kinase n=1 Tax=Clostridium sp. ZS2-4 TaxID=2987703 RepID=UPI00227A7132|nr:HAMP domain-containing sensor histidine kinase [Clostridium sp. ZS2-4]MCY6356300.1 HAMP domain-containing sensor histidine kinase [Clostridium sp. ZS2-4]
MDTKWKKYSHSLITKIIVFIIVITCFTGTITTVINTFDTIDSRDADFDIIFKDNYYLGNQFTRQNEEIIRSLVQLIEEYKSKEYILKGGSITKQDMEDEENNLFSSFEENSNYYNPNLSNGENYKKFKEVYKEEISQIKNKLIQQDLQAYHNHMKKLKDFKGIIYYASDGKNKITNSSNVTKDYFKTFPCYMILDEAVDEVYPKEIKDNEDYYFSISDIDQLDRIKSTMYIGFSDEYLNSNIEKWEETKAIVTKNLYRAAAFLAGLILSFIYLVLIIGRKSFKDKEVHLNSVDRLYNDINLGLCLGLIMLWFVSITEGYSNIIYKMISPVTASIAALGLILVLSLIKHFKNSTLLNHTLTYSIFHKIVKSIKDVYDSGKLGTKVILIIMIYSILVALTSFISVIIIGAGIWLALKQVEKFNAIKKGVEIIKNGDIHHTIDIQGEGELAILAANINGITDGLKEAVNNEVRSQRLKNELITNVSHDIRTPLTSIITYVDLLKTEKDQSKLTEYIEILDQKSQRLKILTDDLFEASKASSGNIPVNYEKIDIISLITQGLGELNDKIEAMELEFKMNYPKDKVYITADGKLLWRAIENLLSNIFKYALKGSRVYIDIENLGSEVMLTIKNISAYELNISADELMERFKRGDESRSTQGSGLGLSIAKSLIDIQKGSLNIEIDGDLFKAIIKMPKYKTSNN